MERSLKSLPNRRIMGPAGRVGTRINASLLCVCSIGTIGHAQTFLAHNAPPRRRTLEHEPNRKGVLQMFAEFLRELAVLILVFYPIEDPRHLAGSLAHVVLISVTCLVLGIALERFR
jgi:hypothetical protein